MVGQRSGTIFKQCSSFGAVDLALVSPKARADILRLLVVGLAAAPLDDFAVDGGEELPKRDCAGWRDGAIKVWPELLHSERVLAVEPVDCRCVSVHSYDHLLCVSLAEVVSCLAGPRDVDITKISPDRLEACESICTQEPYLGRLTITSSRKKFASHFGCFPILWVFHDVYWGSTVSLRVVGRKQFEVEAPGLFAWLAQGREFVVNVLEDLSSNQSKNVSVQLLFS